MVQSKEVLCHQMLVNVVSEYSIRKVQGNQVGLKVSGTHQILVYVHYVNLLGDNMETIKRNTETLVDAS
jgi:hypothetical protein